ncbi:probable cyclin-dependent serine/threonine-protein kinase DDB_G0292550 isoform X2 [Vanessa cardui]|uniref:probable cyclin-dependent serine/threonine-protein kinase DDB_G0292550 isoform X2 n=1 Tax=Vanessa cardui TaxID=171605 RepID=UPI001F132A43|nr:probable cyclin-dependent serine/threonine-protein kinase DDB_G0292550 isoform X2 [Vanessa cardui]
MLCLLIFAFYIVPWTNAQSERSKRPFDNGHGWDIRLAVPGEPGNDYPTLNSIPRTTFTCSGKDPGYYADIETNCQVFRVCTLGSTYGFQSFLCPNGTLFNQEVFVCDWWMNVNCQKTREIINNRNEKFRNLKLGPQFMTDIKKMITHPIRNPYDRSNVKNNLIFMQVYKPPLGQLYNEALLRNLERNTNDIYAKKKQQKSYQDPFTNDITVAASTPTTQYIPNYIFQNQLQNNPYSQLQSLTSNAHGGQTSQTRGQDMLYYNNNIQSIRSPISSNTKAQIKTYNNSQINKNKQVQFGLEYSKQRFNQNINNEKQSYTHEPTQARYSKDTVGRIETETKQNLDLVFSFLADSINAAKEYSNVAQQNILYPTPTQQFQNIRNDQLESSNAIKTPNSKFSSSNRDYKNLSSNFTISQTQQAPQNKISSSQNLKYSVNSDNIYSGQLYQLPVPVVTKQIYNSPVPSISNYILSTNFLPINSQTDTKKTHDQRNSNDVEIIPSQIIPTSAYETKTHENEQVGDQGSAANAFIDNYRIPTNAIRTQVHDNIIGTIPHPLEEDKLIKYKKDQSYYIYTHLNNNFDNIIGNNRNTYDVQQQNRENTELSKLINPSFQLLPSLSYKLEDEKEKQNFLNAFQIDKFGNPKRNTFPNSEKSANIERRQDIGSDIDYTINHPPSSSYLSALYDGPSSYSAPQASVGSLTGKQNYQSDSTFNANIEKFDTIDDSNGYPKISPLKKFTF